MKKYISQTKVLFLAAMVLFSTSCKKLLDINADPNNPDVGNATPEVLFPSATISSAGMIGGQLAVAGGIWSQYWAQSSNSSQYREIDAYNVTSTSEVVNAPYNQLFSGALNDFTLIQKQASAKADWRYNLMATVLKAYTYQVLVDLYDKVPYTEAFKGQAILQPKFDDGADIYTALLAEINSALTKDVSLPFSQSQKRTDFVFGGDMNKWKAFANTLKLKMYLRMVNAKPVEADAGIKALYASGAAFLTVDAGIIDVFVDVPNNSSPMYEYNIRRLNTTTNIRASFTLASFLTTNNDPRAVPYFKDTVPVAIHQGDYTATITQQPTYAKASVFVQKATDPVYFISKAESCFMQAEALERCKGGVGADVMYNEGVKAAFAQNSLTPGTLLTGAYAYPATGSFDQKLEAIIVQKWLSMVNSHSLEAFFEQNRTGYPTISAVYSTNAAYIPGRFVYSANGVTGAGKFPKRFPFPDDERSRNKNTPAEVPITTKVWWAK